MFSHIHIMFFIEINNLRAKFSTPLFSLQAPWWWTVYRLFFWADLSGSFWACCRWFGGLNLQFFLLASCKPSGSFSTPIHFPLSSAKARSSVFWKSKVKLLPESGLWGIRKILWVKTFFCWRNSLWLDPFHSKDFPQAIVSPLMCDSACLTIK